VNAAFPWPTPPKNWTEDVGTMRRSQENCLAILFVLALHLTLGSIAQAQVEKVAAKAQGEL
jgi:hypothetical protein